MNAQGTTQTTERATLELVLKRLEALDARLETMAARQRKTDELIADMTPIAREAMGAATAKLDALDKKGYFAFGKEALSLADRVVAGFTPEDVRQLGDAVVGILQTVRALTQSAVLDIANEASAVLEQADKAEPIGILGLVRATGDDEVQKGLSVMMQVMKHVGRAAGAVRSERKRDPNAERKAKLAAVLGPRPKKSLGTERTPTTRLGPPAACAVPSDKPRAVAAVIDGVAFGADGHLVDPGAWTRELGEKLAKLQGVELDEARWAVITFARSDFLETKASPNIRRLTQGTNLATKDLYSLFPKAPARTVAKIAGIPKPAGCI